MQCLLDYFGANGLPCGLYLLEILLDTVYKVSTEYIFIAKDWTSKQTRRYLPNRCELRLQVRESFDLLLKLGDGLHGTRFNASGGAFTEHNSELVVTREQSI